MTKLYYSTQNQLIIQYWVQRSSVLTLVICCKFSQQVYLMQNTVIKIFVEGGLEASIYGLGTEV